MIVPRASEPKLGARPIQGALGALHRSRAGLSKEAALTTVFHNRRRWIPAVVAIVLLTVTPPIARAEPVQRPTISRADATELDVYVAEAARRFALPTALIRTIMRVESAGKPQAVSPKGARGLMQIMPRTWDELRSRLALGADPFDAHDNIMAGAAYLRQLRDRYGTPGFLAAYNAGPGRYEDHMATGRPLPFETIGYVTAAIRLLNGGSHLEGRSSETPARPWTEAALFAAFGSAEGVARIHAADSPVTATNRRTLPVAPTLVPHSDGLFASADIRKVRP